MRSKLTFLLLTALLVAGCQPQIVYIVLSPTPSTEALSTEIAAASTPELTPEVVLATDVPVAEATLPVEVTAVAQSVTEVVLPNTDITPISPETSLTVPPTETPGQLTPSATELPPNYPTPVFQQIQVAEQLFEHGRMFWLQPTQEIWVLIITAEGRGTWTVYNDTYLEGEPANDPSLVPPEGFLQPERGFGKLWREVDQLREQLGWAVTPEFGYVSRYEFHAGGTIDAQGVFQSGFGYHILYSLYGEQFRFNETDSTWQLGGG